MGGICIFFSFSPIDPHLSTLFPLSPPSPRISPHFLWGWVHYGYVGGYVTCRLCIPEAWHMKCKDVIDMLLYFRFKDKLTRWQSQEKSNTAQKACSTLFLSVPMATLCQYVTVAWEMAV